MVGQQDAAGAGPPGQGDRVVRRRVAEGRLGGDLVGPQERVVDQQVHARGQGERVGVILAPAVGARA